MSAGDGVEAKRALEMAASDLNEGGGVLGRKLETASLDIESDLVPDKVRNALQRLVNEKGVSMVSMVWCDYANTGWDPVTSKGLPLFHANASITNTGWVAEDPVGRGMIFESDPNETWYGPNLVGLLDRIQASGKWKPRQKSVAIVTSTDPYSTLIADTFREEIQKTGWKVVMFEKVSAPLSEWGPVLAKVRELNPDVVVNTDWLAQDLAAFTKQFASAPTQSLVYEQFGPSMPEYLDLTGDAANGVLWSTNIGVLPDKMGEDFRARFERAVRRQDGLQHGRRHLRPGHDVGERGRSRRRRRRLPGRRQAAQERPVPRHRRHLPLRPEGQPGACRTRPSTTIPAWACRCCPTRSRTSSRWSSTPPRTSWASSSCRPTSRESAMTAILETEDLTKRFGALAAVDAVSCEVEQGEVFGIAGPNGAGKTTLFDVISGHARATEGVVRFKGQEIQHLPAYSICHMGMARTYQVASVLTTQTVLGNIVLASYFGHRAARHGGPELRPGDGRAR